MNNGIILMIHGNSVSSQIFHGITTESGLDYKKVAVDLPGHGENANWSSEFFTFKGLTDFVIEIAQKIEGPILLVGFSLGGHLAMRAAPFIDNLKGLLVCGAAPLKKPLNIGEAYLPNKLIGNFYVESPEQEAILETISNCVNNHQLIPFLLSEFAKTNRKLRAELGNEFPNPDSHPDEYMILKDLNCKKILLHGEDDPFVDKRYLDSILSDIDAELTIFPHCGHYHPLEKPSEFTALLNTICNEIFRQL